jgi:hypothetical protein
LIKSVDHRLAAISTAHPLDQEAETHLSFIITVCICAPLVVVEEPIIDRKFSNRKKPKLYSSEEYNSNHHQYHPAVDLSHFREAIDCEPLEHLVNNNVLLLLVIGDVVAARQR